jgi:hypothetical protein
MRLCTLHSADVELLRIRYRRLCNKSLLIPASTSNLGPGFDCLGVAFNVHNRAVLTRGARVFAAGETGWRLFPPVGSETILVYA